MRERLYASWTDAEQERFYYDWPSWARADQRPPDGDWRTWLILGGRGSGKTRAGAEWVRAEVEGATPHAPGARRRIALVGPTLLDVREVMIDGVSGLRAIARPGWRPQFQVSRRRLEWPNGAVAQAFSAEDPDSLRGPQFDIAWCDELCAWARPELTLANLDLGLRLGPEPRKVVTTTPKPIAALKALLAAPDTATTRAATRANAAFLPPAFLAAMEAAFAGTRLGRQELGGEIVEDRDGALWTRAMMERAFDPDPPALDRVVVGVDPPVTAGPRADACGIIVAGAAGQARARGAWVLADRTVQGLAPEGWARRVVDAAEEFDADRVVVEVNQGGALVRSVLEVACPALPVREVRARRGKVVRAEPVAALYERGRVRHAGRFPALEDEMCAFGALPSAASPDRVDALVWAITDLVLAAAAPPRLRPL